MAVSFVRALIDDDSTGVGNAAGVALTHDVPAGHVLVALAGGRSGPNSPSPLSINKPGGESATWLSVASGAYSSDVGGKLWAIKTTVTWPAGTVVTAQWFAFIDRRGMVLAEFTGVEKIVRGVAGGASGAASVAAATTGPQAVRGDLVLGAGMQYSRSYADSIAVDTDVTAGAWMTAGASNGRADLADDFGVDLLLQYKIATAAGAQTYDVQGIRFAATPTTDRKVVALAVGLQSSNVAPNAPTLLTMADGGSIDRSRTNRARHAFSDPNVDDSQSAFDHRYRLVGDPSWITGYEEVPNQFVDFPGGTFAAGDYERQIRTYDALGVAGPWSTSGFFTAQDATPGPTITHPVDGSTFEQVDHADWSAPNQDVYQVRRVADDGGVPDELTVYYDSGEVTDAITRSVPLTFETNDRAEHVQVRVKYAGLWSDWVSVSGEASYSPPPVPTFLIYPDTSDASVLVAITNPPPDDEDSPAAIYNDVYVDDGGGETRRVAGLATNTSWRYRTPPSGRDWSLSIRVEAVAANGTTSSSGG